MYKISIILPVFNVEKYLKRCLSSLLKQTIGFENLEVIFIDDFSDDESFSIINNFSKKYDNIKVFQTESNSGSAGHPRNIGLENASTDYVMFLDPDDIYFEDACEKLYFNAINSGADIVSGNYISYSEGKKEKPINFKNYFGDKSDYFEIESITECPQLLTMIPALWTKIYKRNFLNSKKITFLEKVVSQDLYFVNQCLINAKKIVYIDTPIVKYEIRDDEESKSVTATLNRKNLLDYIYVYNKLYSLFENFEKDYGWMASVHLFFCTIQFVKNKNKIDKYDYLHNSEKLYSEFNNHYFPKKEYKCLFDLINNHNYIDAIKLSELMYNKMYDPDNILNLKEKEVLFLFNSQQDLNDFLIKNSDELAELSSKLNFSFIDFDMDNKKKTSKDNNHEKYEDILDNINVINICKYFNYQFSINQYKDNSENTSDNSTGGLKNSYDGDYIKLFKKDYELSFKSLSEFKCYFITKYCLNFKSKVFIIQTEDELDLSVFNNSAYIHTIKNETTVIDILNNAYFDSNVNHILEKAYANQLQDLINSHQKTIESNKEKIQNYGEILEENKKNISDLEIDISNFQKFIKQLNSLICEKNRIIENQEDKLSYLNNLIKIQDKILKNNDKMGKDVLDVN